MLRSTVLSAVAAIALPLALSASAMAAPDSIGKLPKAPAAQAAAIVLVAEATRPKQAPMAAKDVILYNISAASATQLIEIGAIVANGLLTRQTTFHRYDIGEPFIAYTDAGGRTVSLDGVIVAFHDGERLALTRVESMPDDGIDRENLYDVGDPAPLDIDVDIADGVEVPSAWEFSVYGVVVPVPSPARPGPLPHQHEAADGDAPAGREQGQQLGTHNAARTEIVAQERHRMRLQ